MIRDGRRREEAGKFESAVAVRRAHHGNLDALIGQSSDTSGPFSFDRGPPFELEAELLKKSIVPPRSSTTIPTLSIRLSAMGPIYKVSSSPATLFATPSHERDVEAERSFPNSLLGADHGQSGSYGLVSRIATEKRACVTLFPDRRPHRSNRNAIDD
jgi:hypothetical protein